MLIVWESWELSTDHPKLDEKCAVCASVKAMSNNVVTPNIGYSGQMLPVRRRAGLRALVSVLLVVVSGCFLAACDGGGGAQSSQVRNVSGEGGQSADIVMSGSYELDVSTGKLLNPARNWGIERPSEVPGMEENNARGARSAAEYFIRVLDYTWNSGDSSLLREVSLPDCVWCQRHIERTDQRREVGGWIYDAEFTIAKVEDTFEIEGHPGLWNTTLEIIQEDKGYYDGTTVHEGISNRTTFLVQTRFDSGRWRVWAAVGEEDIQK